MKSSIDSMTEETIEITDQISGIRLMSTEELLKLTRSIFGSYSHMNKCKNLTKDYIFSLGDTKHKAIKPRIDILISQAQILLKS